MARTPKKVMVIKIIREGSENLALTIPETRANLAKLAEMGEVRTLKVRNPWGRSGKPVPAPVKRGRKSAKVTAAA